MSNIEAYRKRILGHLSAVNSFSQSWEQFEPVVREKLSSNLGQSVFSLGDSLSEIFRSNMVTGRGQAVVAGAGTVWECLVAWYLNFVFTGTNVIAARQNRLFVPGTITKALTVTIANQRTNSESDVIVFCIPDEFNRAPSSSLESLDNIIRNNLQSVDLSVIQCKTNWNENSQIPMLWDLIYNSTDFRIPNISVGIEGFNPVSFRRFSYAFATVPTSRGPFTQNKLCVLRVKNLTGGNYWGCSTSAGVASSIKEFFTRNFPSAFQEGGVESHLQSYFSENVEDYNNYKSLNF